MRGREKEYIILFPSEPFSPKEVDSAFSSEYEAAKLAGFKVYLFDHDEFVKTQNFKTNLPLIPEGVPNKQIILRSWMLRVNSYNALYGHLTMMGYDLINGTRQYTNCHHFPEVFPLIKELTSKAWWSGKHLNPEEIEWSNVHWQPIRDFFDGDVIIKDYVKSEKGEPDLFILSKSLTEQEFNNRIQRFKEARGKLFNAGIVFKEVVPLKKYETSNGFVTNEWRIFCLNKDFIYVNLNVESDKDLPMAKPEFIIKCYEIAKTIDSNFFTIDVAEKEDGSWMILETGDGQVSGLPIKCMPLGFYTKLKEHLK